MSEYIVKCREFVGVTGKTFQFPIYIDQTEEIVRCRDCRHFNGYHNKCHRQQGVIVVLGDIVRIDEQKERLVLTDAEPDGFCKWAVSRDA